MINSVNQLIHRGVFRNGTVKTQLIKEYSTLGKSGIFLGIDAKRLVESFRINVTLDAGKLISVKSEDGRTQKTCQINIAAGVIYGV